MNHKTTLRLAAILAALGAVLASPNASGGNPHQPVVFVSGSLGQMPIGDTLAVNGLTTIGGATGSTDLLSIIGNGNQLTLTSTASPASTFTIHNNGAAIWDVDPTPDTATDSWTLRFFRHTVTTGNLSIALTPGNSSTQTTSLSGNSQSFFNRGLSLQSTTSGVDVLDVSDFTTAQTVNRFLIKESVSGTSFNTTSGALTNTGLYATVGGFITTGTNPLTNYAVDAVAGGGANTTNYGVYAVSQTISGTPTADYGIYASATGATTNYSGYFDQGNFQVNGPATISNTFTVSNGVFVTSGDITTTDDASPSAPSSGSAKYFSQHVANRDMAGVYPSYGAPYQFQPHLGRRHITSWNPRSGLAQIDAIGTNAGVAGGTITARVSTASSPTLLQSLRRVGMVSGSVAGNFTGLLDNASYDVWRGNTAGQGGFHLIMKWSITDTVSTARMFVGLLSNVSVSDVNPSTLTQIIGVGGDSGDTVLQVYSAGTSAQARTSLGANFPINTSGTDIYELDLFAAADDTSVYYTVNRYTTSQVAPAFTASGQLTGTTAQLISNSTMFEPYIYRTNGGTASAVSFDLIGMYIETDL